MRGASLVRITADADIWDRDRSIPGRCDAFRTEKCVDRFSAVHWGLAGYIVIARIITLPATAAVSALFYLLVNATA